MLPPGTQTFEGPLPLTQINGQAGEVYRYGYGLALSENGDAANELQYTVYILEDSTALGQQVATFRTALWRYLGGAGVVLLLLQMWVLRWSLRPLRDVIGELKRVQAGSAAGMSEAHPRELEPLTDSINAFIHSERENLERQRNTLADLAHSLKTPLAVLRSRLDSDTGEPGLRSEVDTQLRRMNGWCRTNWRVRPGRVLDVAARRVRPQAGQIVLGLEKVYANKGVLCGGNRRRGRYSRTATCRNCWATCRKTPSNGRSREC